MKLTVKEARAYIADHPETILQPDRSGAGYICPICGSGSGKNGTGLFIERDRQHYTCFAGGCIKNKSIFDIIGKQYGLTAWRDIISKAASLAGVTLTDIQQSDGYTPVKKEKPPEQSQEHTEAARKAADYMKFYHIAHRDIDKTDYWSKRGFTRETMSRFKIGYNEAFKTETGETWKALIIPVTAHAFTARNTDPDAAQRYTKRGDAAALYNPLKIDLAHPEQAVFLVEGELDALSIIQAGGAAIAYRSKNNTNTMIDALLKARPRCILGITDNDKAGREAEQSINDGLKDSGIYFESYSFPPYKDANELLQHDPETLTKFIENINKAYERIYNK